MIYREVTLIKPMTDYSELDLLMETRYEKMVSNYSEKMNDAYRFDAEFLGESTFGIDSSKDI